MKSGKENFENYSKFKIAIAKLLKYPKDTKVLHDLKNVLAALSPELVQRSQKALLAALAHMFANHSSYNENTRMLLTEILHNLFEKSSIDNLMLFMNVYGYLLVEIFDDKDCKIRPISEEYKLKIMECMKTVMKSVASEIILELYKPEYAPRLASMVYVAKELAKSEKMRKLKISAMQCIMAIAKVLDDEDFKDIIVCREVLKVFIYLLPGIATGLVNIATEDEKMNHKVPAEAVKAWGRIVTLLMQNYESPTQRPKPSIKDFKMLIENGRLTGKSDTENCYGLKNSINKCEFTPQWYKKTDENLTILAIKLNKLVYHGHTKVKLELLKMCQLVLTNCLMTMPVCSAVLVEIIIVLIEDENEEVSERSREFLENFAEKFDSEDLSILVSYLQDNFYRHLAEIPRNFNSLDLRKQSYSLNVIYGFLTVFGRYRLNEVLLTGNNLETLLKTLIHISELERSKTGLFEDYSNKDINSIENSNITWKNFKLFTDKKLQLLLEKLCKLLAFSETFPLVTDFLLDHFISEPFHRKNTTYILNQVILGCKYNDENHTFVMNVLNTYIDCNYLQIPLKVNNGFGVEQSLTEVQDNAIQVCLLVEGIGKIALIMGKCFQQCLFKVMYLLLEKAGNDHVLVRKAALLALEDVANSCEYKSIAEMINNNIDYFAFHIDKKLNRSDNKDEVLNVFSVVIKYSSLDTLHYISDIIQEVMVQSCDKFKERYADNYLKIFKIFLLSLWQWMGIVTKVDKIKCKAQKIEEIEHFQVTGAKTEAENDFSDDITGKSAQELFEEDMKKSQEELQREIEEPEVEEYKKPEPPIHIKLTVNIISRSLHFLPSKNRIRKLLVLEILNLGLEAIKDWENELLPIVHQIWSPLSQRFKEIDPLVFNNSFCLLMTMAKHAREFIKMRTEKEVLPSINQVLDKLSKESYLKDKGSAYRYSQNYKLQLVILENLGIMMAYLDVQEKTFLDTSEVVFKYLSDKQPIFLQSAAIRFFKQIYHYDPPTVKKVFEKCLEKFKSDEFKKNVTQCNIF